MRDPSHLITMMFLEVTEWVLYLLPGLSIDQGEKLTFLMMSLGIVLLFALVWTTLELLLRLSKGVKAWVVNQVRERLVEKVYVAHLDDNPGLPLAEIRLVRRADGKLVNVVFRNQTGKAIAVLPGVVETVFPGPEDAHVPEMAARGALPHRHPPSVKETRYGILFSDDEGNKVGVGFAIKIRDQIILVTANHVYENSTKMRGAHSTLSYQVPTQGKTLSDVRFIHAHPDTLSCLGVAMRKTPSKVHRGTAHVFVLRDRGYDAPCVIENIHMGSNGDPFVFTHVSNTAPGDSGSPILVGRARTPVAVHVAGLHDRGKNAAVALVPLIRILYADHTDDPVLESDDRYEAIFKYVDPDSFHDVRSRRRDVHARKLNGEGRGYAVDVVGHYTVFPPGHALWADAEDDDSLPDFDLPDYVFERAYLDTPQSTPEVLPSVEDPQVEPLFRLRPPTPRRLAVQDLRGMMPNPTPPKPKPTGIQLLEKNTTASPSVEKSIGRRTTSRARQERSSPESSLNSTLSSEATNIRLQKVEKLLEHSLKQLEEQQRRAPLMQDPPVEKSTLESGNRPGLSEHSKGPTSRASSKRRRKRSSGLAAPATLSRGMPPRTSSVSNTISKTSLEGQWTGSC